MTLSGDNKKLQKRNLPIRVMAIKKLNNPSEDKKNMPKYFRFTNQNNQKINFNLVPDDGDARHLVRLKLVNSSTQAVNSMNCENFQQLRVDTNILEFG